MTLIIVNDKIGLSSRNFVLLNYCCHAIYWLAYKKWSLKHHVCCLFMLALI